MNSLCILCSHYPNSVTPTSQVFIQQFVWAMADMGIVCTVICPVAINLNPKLVTLPFSTTELTNNKATVNIFFPKFISFGQQEILGIKTARFTTDLFYLAIQNVWKHLKIKPNVVYGHFLTPAGICASRISKKFKISGFAAYGESSPWSIIKYGEDNIKKELSNLNGIVAVSSSNQKDLENVKIFPMSKVKVFPNGIRLSHFYPRNKQEARRKFGFEPDAFIVAFMGHFIERKGVLRLAEAVRGLEFIKVAFAGKGPQQPDVPNCIYSNIVKPEDVPFFLSAADVFVLPTLNEGCCNAIVEAMACGLPIISSDLPFNADILDQSNSLLIDPNNIQEIREAILHLKNNPALCENMGKNSLQRAKDFTLEKRAENICSWIHQMI